jgi:hypothetical protein
VADVPHELGTCSALAELKQAERSAHPLAASSAFSRHAQFVKQSSKCFVTVQVLVKFIGTAAAGELRGGGLPFAFGHSIVALVCQDAHAFLVHFTPQTCIFLTEGLWRQHGRTWMMCTG